MPTLSPWTWLLVSLARSGKTAGEQSQDCILNSCWADLKLYPLFSDGHSLFDIDGCFHSGCSLSWTFID